MFSVAAACAVTGAEATFHVSSELGADLPASMGTRAGSTARVATTGAHDDVPAVPHGEDCAMMKLVVDFAQHRGRQATHARFDEATPRATTMGPVKTQFGHHLIQVYEVSEKKA